LIVLRSFGVAILGILLGWLLLGVLGALSDLRARRRNVDSNKTAV